MSKIVSRILWYTLWLFDSWTEFIVKRIRGSFKIVRNFFTKFACITNSPMSQIQIHRSTKWSSKMIYSFSKLSAQQIDWNTITAQIQKRSGRKIRCSRARFGQLPIQFSFQLLRVFMELRAFCLVSSFEIVGDQKHLCENFAYFTPWQSLHSSLPVRNTQFMRKQFNS